ncbi:MAG: nucleotide exchange factor GrpE [Archangiaceae bacterium]|nr:nucleotide exchange factor GrpE [Archangiaceae bacterium]
MNDEGAPVDLVAELETARKRIDELARAYQALERDRDDFKKRLQRERDRLIDVERGEVALSLLEAIDDLDLALAEADDTPLARGVRVIRENLLKKAEQLGIERVPLLGKTFDPTVAEAADLEVTPEAEKDNLVTAELRAAYRLKDRVVRPARVKVARYVKAAQA